MKLQTRPNLGDFPMDYGFEIEEACALLNYAVVELDNNSKKPQIRDIGIIVGVLTFNDEVELIVKFLDELRQYTKSEFASQLKIIKD